MRGSKNGRRAFTRLIGDCADAALRHAGAGRGSDAVLVFPGQRVITSEGVVRTVAFTDPRGVWVFGPSGRPYLATIRADAWGGEPSLAA